MSLIKTPFKKKRSTIAGDGKRSPSMTPRSARGSTGRSSSVGSSVNSYEESENIVDSNINASTKNIYADIDIDDETCGFATNKIAKCDENTPPELPAANLYANEKFEVLQVSTINECENFEECVEVTEDDLLKVPGIENKLNCSKNNLLLIEDQLMTTSIDNHLNNIELINKNLDKLMEAHREIEIDDSDDSASSEIKAEKIKLKKKLAEKIKMLKEARMMSPSTSDATTKESFKSRVKNIFPKFEKQTSQDDPHCDEVKKEKSRIGKGFLSSFKKKSVEQTTVVDETDEDFEEIKKISIESQAQVTDLDENLKADCGVKEEKFSSKFKHKFKLIASKMGKKTPSPGICRHCSKNRIHKSKATFDLNKDFHTETLFNNEFCVCFDVDGVCIKNIEYKDVSLSCWFFIWHEFGMLRLLNYH